MSSKNLFGENAEKCKKVLKNQYTKAVQFRAQNNQDSNCVLAKKGVPGTEITEWVLWSTAQWTRVEKFNVNDPLDPGSELYVSRASLQDDVR